MKRRPAKSLSNKLIGILSRRGAAIVIISIVCSPIFTYSPYDQTYVAFLQTFESVKTECTGQCLDDLFNDMNVFYSSNDLKPIDLYLDGVGTFSFSSDDNLRDDNIVEVKENLSYMRMNMQNRNQRKAWFNMVLVTIILALLIGFGASFNGALDTLVVIPLERMVLTLGVVVF